MIRKSERRDANIVSSHVLYKSKVEDDGSSRLNARIALHGKEHSDAQSLRFDCCMWSLTDICIVARSTAVQRWRIMKVDVEMAFHPSGTADDKVYGIPPRESKLKNKLLVRLVAGYGSVNANSNWQLVSCNDLLELGLENISTVPLLFVKRSTNREVPLLVIQIVDEISAAGRASDVRSFVQPFGKKFMLRTLCKGPGKLRFYRLCIEQYEDFYGTINADEKLQSLEAYHITRVRRQLIDEKLNSIERRAFMSIISSISWLGTTVSPFCPCYSSICNNRSPIAM